MARSERSKYYRKHSTSKNILVKLSGMDYQGSLLAKRNVRLVIREAALRRSLVAMLYTKLTTGDTLEYHLEPYSYRYRHLRMGIRKVFFGFKVGPPRRTKNPTGIRMFFLPNIHAVKILPTKFRPRWQVEF